MNISLSFTMMNGLMRVCLLMRRRFRFCSSKVSLFVEAEGSRAGGRGRMRRAGKGARGGAALDADADGALLLLLGGFHRGHLAGAGAGADGRGDGGGDGRGLRKCCGGFVCFVRVSFVKDEVILAILLKQLLGSRFVPFRRFLVSSQCAKVSCQYNRCIQGFRAVGKGGGGLDESTLAKGFT